MIGIIHTTPSIKWLEPSSGWKETERSRCVFSATDSLLPRTKEFQWTIGRGIRRTWSQDGRRLTYHARHGDGQGEVERANGDCIRNKVGITEIPKITKIKVCKE